MKILHLCLTDGYTDNSEYQENILAKYHKKMGHEVVVISSQFIYEKGIWIKNARTDYYDSNEVFIKRIKYLFPFSHRINQKFGLYSGLNKELDKIKPDILFIHNFQFLSILQVRKYVKKNEAVTYIDNHVDYVNSGRNIISKYLFHKFLWRICGALMVPFTKKFYGVLPARVEFLKSVYKLPSEKCELLCMGADDEKINDTIKELSRKKIREKAGIDNDDILIVTGGKINEFRQDTLNLLDAVSNINEKHVKLLVFGTVSEKLRTKFEEKCDNRRIMNVGWVDSDETYRIMASADLIIFPGQHSVMWEQAVALGVPCIFKRIDGFSHVDVGGNCIFIDDTSEDGLKKVILDVINSGKLNDMRKVASKKGMEEFSCFKIAQKSIEE